MKRNTILNGTLALTLAAALAGGAALAPVAAYADEAADAGLTIVDEAGADAALEGTELEVTVAKGTARNACVPIAYDATDCYTLSQTIIPADMLDGLADSDINAITLHADTSNVSCGKARFRVFLKEVDESANTRGRFYNLGVNNATFAYEGALDVAEDGTVRIPVNRNDFHYNGGNLLVSIQNVRCGSASRTVRFRGIDAANASVWGTSTIADSFQPTVANFIPMMTIEATAAPVATSTVSIAIDDHAEATVTTEDGTVVNDGDQLPVGQALTIKASAEQDFALSVSCGDEELTPLRDGTYTCETGEGTTEIRIAAADTMPRLEATRPTLDGTIGLVAVVKMPEAGDIDWANAKMGFDVSGKSGRHVDVALADATDLGDGRYGFALPLSAIEMAQPVNATLTCGDETQTWEGLTLENAIEELDGVTDAELAYNHALADLGYHSQTLLCALHKWNLGTDYAKMNLFYTAPGEFDQRAIREELDRHESHVRHGEGVDKMTYSLTCGSTIDATINLYVTKGASVDAIGDFHGNTYKAEKVSDTQWKVTIEGIRPDQLGEEFQVTGSVNGSSFEFRSSGLAYANSIAKSGKYGAEGDNAIFALWNLGAATAGLAE